MAFAMISASAFGQVIQRNVITLTPPNTPFGPSTWTNTTFAGSNMFSGPMVFTTIANTNAAFSVDSIGNGTFRKVTAHESITAQPTNGSYPIQIIPNSTGNAAEIVGRDNSNTRDVFTVSTNGDFVGKSFTGDGSGLTGVTATLPPGVVTSSSAQTYYVAPNGSDSNTGKATNAPLATVYQASRLATNYGDLIVQMPGINTNELANPRYIRLTNGVSFKGELGSTLYLTNFAGSIPGGVNFRPGPNSVIEGLNIFYLDGAFSTAGPFGFYGKSPAASNDDVDITNCIVNNLRIISPTQGIHIEGNANAHSIGIVFNAPYVMAGGNCFQQKTMTTGNVNISVNNPTFVATNWPGRSQNTKPIRAWALGASGRLTASGGSSTYGDTSVTNIAAYGIYFEGAVDGIVFQNHTFDGSQATNNAQSAEMNGQPILSGVVKSDGSELRMWNGVSLTNVTIPFQNVATNTSPVFTVGTLVGNGSGLTNIPLSAIQTNGFYVAAQTNNFVGRIPWFTNGSVIYYMLAYTNANP